MPRTPIVIFLYKRPRHARQLLDSLQKCSRLAECDIFIYCDGVKNPVDAASVDETRRIATEFASRNNGSVVKREQNMGLARSIVSGVTELCEQNNRVIVLEDDFILHPFFLDFMLQALDRYANDECVAQVAGFTFPINMPAKPDAFFLPLSTSWGWATWRRAWKLFSWETESALQILEDDPQMRTRFDLDGAYPYSDMLRLVTASKVDSWAIRWYWQIFSRNKVTLFPRQSLVWQNGFDDSATHTKKNWPGMQEPINKFLEVNWDLPISFPKVIETNVVVFESLKRFLRSRSQNSPKKIPNIKRAIKRAWSRLSRY